MSSFAEGSRCAVLLAARQSHLLSRRILPSDRSRVQKGGAKDGCSHFRLSKTRSYKSEKVAEIKRSFEPFSESYCQSVTDVGEHDRRNFWS